jgi:hydrogenase nickel incorporation protein HypB
MSDQNTADRKVDIRQPVMSANDRIAEANRDRFAALGAYVINMISSPGAGKTTLLQAMAERMADEMAVIVGDLQTRRDAERVREKGVRAHQIETGGACHLDARAVMKATGAMDLQPGDCKVLVVENVGNLVCPASFELGEHMKVALLSLPEGDDKVLKYPSIFSRIGALLITKTDLAPHMDFDVDRAIAECESLNKDFRTFQISARTGEGVDAFCDFLLAKQSGLTA